MQPGVLPLQCIFFRGSAGESNRLLMPVSLKDGQVPLARRSLPMWGDSRCGADLLSNQQMHELDVLLRSFSPQSLVR